MDGVLLDAAVVRVRVRGRVRVSLGVGVGVGVGAREPGVGFTDREGLTAAEPPPEDPCCEWPLDVDGRVTADLFLEMDLGDSDPNGVMHFTARGSGRA